MSPVNCEICFKGFNDSNQKPRNLPCGHVYCSSCIDQSISHGSTICPACRTSHGADSALDLPVNFYILKLVDDQPEPKEEEKQNEDSDEEFHAGSCSKHKSSNLYFICRTHNVQLCRECTVIDHRPDICDVISFQDHLEESKSDLIVEANTEIHYAKDTNRDLQCYVKAKEDELKKKNDQVQCLLKEIESDAKKQDEAKKKIIEIEEIQKGLESLKTELSSAIKKSDLTISSENMRVKLNTAKMLEDKTVSNFLFSDLALSERLLSERPRRFFEIFRKKLEVVVHAYQQSGSARRSAKLLLKDGKICCNALRENYEVYSQNDVVVQASYLLNLAVPQYNISSAEIQNIPLEIQQARPEVFLTFASNGNTLGTVYISVDPNAVHSKQFLDLCIGNRGCSYRGVNELELQTNEISQGNTYGIACKYYIQESDSEKQMKDDVSSMMVFSSTRLHYMDIGKDKHHSEAKIQFKINNFSKLKGIIFSSPCFVRNLSWKIRVEPHISMSSGKQPQHYLSFFLLCFGESETTNWSCNANVKFRLLSICEKQEPFTMTTQHLFNSEDLNGWGNRSFTGWNDILNPEKGYIDNDTITLEVLISADASQIDMKNKEATCENKENLYIDVQVLLEDAFYGHQGNDLYNPDKASYQSFKVKKTTSLQNFLEQVADKLKYPVEQIRPWPLTYQDNGALRPELLDLEKELQIPLIDLSNDNNSWFLFIETVSPKSGLKALPAFDKDSDVLIFFKYYDPRLKRLHYCGHHYMHITLHAQDLVSLLNERAGLPHDTNLALFEEINHNLLELLTDLNRPLEEVIEVLHDGTIIVFQRADLLDDPNLDLPSSCDYFKDLFNRVNETSCDKTLSTDNAIGKNGPIKSINKKGELCHYGSSGFTILHEDPSQDCVENFSVIGYVSSGLEIVSNIAKKSADIQPKHRSPIFNVTIEDLGVVIKS